MKIYNTIVLLLLLGCSTEVDAQAQLTVKGIVMDDKASALPSVTISLLNAKDSTLLMQTVSQWNGRYEITYSLPGEFLLKYESIGYQTSFSVSFIAKDGQPVHALPVRLKVAFHGLQGVTVSVPAGAIRMYADKMVLNVRTSIHST